MIFRSQTQKGPIGISALNPVSRPSDPQQVCLSSDGPLITISPISHFGLLFTGGGAKPSPSWGVVEGWHSAECLPFLSFAGLSRQ